MNAKRINQIFEEFERGSKVLPEHFSYKMNTAEVEALQEILIHTQSPQWLIDAMHSEPRKRMLLTFTAKLIFLKCFQRIRSLYEKRHQMEYTVTLNTVEGLLFLMAFGFGGQELSFHAAVKYKISSVIDPQTL